MDSLPLSIYVDHLILWRFKGSWRMTCASTGAESQKTAPSDAWSSPSGGAGLQLGFSILFVRILKPHGATWSNEKMCSNCSTFQTKHFQDRRAKFEQEQVSDKSVFSWDQFWHGRLRPCYLLSRLIANRLATWWPTTQKTHLSTTGTQWTQPRRTKTCVWQSIWKRIINELHFLLYSMTLWVPSLTWNTWDTQAPSCPRR